MIAAIRKRMDEREDGFTLIELLVVVIIIGILAAIAIPTFLNQRERAFRSALQTDLRNVALEAETYFTDTQTYVGFAVPAGFRNSPNVTIGALVLTATTYCIPATHSSMTAAGTWRVTNDPARGAQLAAGSCA